MINILIVLMVFLGIGYVVRAMSLPTYRTPPLRVLSGLSNLRVWRYRNIFSVFGRGSQIEFYLTPEADPELNTVPFFLQFVRETVPPSVTDSWFLASPNPSTVESPDKLRVLLLTGPMFAEPSAGDLSKAIEKMKVLRLELFRAAPRPPNELAKINQLSRSHLAAQLKREIKMYTWLDSQWTKLYLGILFVFVFIFLFKVYIF